MTTRPAAEQTVQYETLRQRALERGPTLARQSLAVLLHHGVTAWMDAWSTVLAGSASAAPVPTVPSAPVADDLRADVVRLLTAMTLGHVPQETYP